MSESTVLPGSLYPPHVDVLLLKRFDDFFIPYLSPSSADEGDAHSVVEEVLCLLRVGEL